MPLSLDGLDGSTPLRKKKAKNQRRIKRGEGWEDPAVTFHLRRLTPPPEETLRLSKRLLIRPRVAGEGSREQIGEKKIILGLLSWRFSLMSQFLTGWIKLAPERNIRVQENFTEVSAFKNIMYNIL